MGVPKLGRRLFWWGRGSERLIGDGRGLLRTLMDENFSPEKMNDQSAILEKLSSQKPLRIVQCDHFNGPPLIEPKNFRFMNVGTHNLSVRQYVGFPADSLETQTANDARRKAQQNGVTQQNGVRQTLLLFCRLPTMVP